ncbi:MAG TPA: amidase [Gemmatimonadota bacterium]|nr:amidase [Gemmatimonadota bacterium]
MVDGIRRRTFLGTGLALGIAGSFGPVPLAASRLGKAARPGRSDFEFEEATIADLQQRMKSGEQTARSLAEAYLTRIEELDRDGPALRALLETNPDALAVADELDAERRAGSIQGPLHGIPVLLKDNIETADRMETTAGSLALLGATPARDAFVSGRLREAGAVVLGKTNLSEWANFRSTASSSGWSARGGQARNPYALDRTPCGSSSGSGTAVAANLCAVAVGTETDGSVVCPASANSVVGIKPTLGLVSRSGIVPLSHSQDTAGPMARTVADAAILLGAMAGADPADPATAGKGGRPQDYTSFLDPHGLEGARIGIPRERFFGYSEESDRIAEAAIEALREAGAVLVDPAELPHAGEYDDSEYEVLLYDFKADLNAYLAGRPGAPVGSLSALIRFNEERRAEEMPFFGQEIFVQAEEKGPLTETAYLEALEKNHRLSRAEGIDKVMDEHRLDALFAPTTSPPWTIDLVNGDHGLGGCSTPAAVAGYPHVTVPAGYAFGLPVGVSFFGRAWSEPVLIRLAYAFEQTLEARRPPRFSTTAELEAP